MARDVYPEFEFARIILSVLCSGVVKGKREGSPPLDPSLETIATEETEGNILDEKN